MTIPVGQRPRVQVSAPVVSSIEAPPRNGWEGPTSRHKPTLPRAWTTPPDTTGPYGRRSADPPFSQMVAASGGVLAAQVSVPVPASIDSTPCESLENT